MAVNRPFKGGFLLKGAYTFSKALNETDDDGWAGLTWNQPSQLHRNYARGRLRPSAHAADGLRVRAAVRCATARTLLRRWSRTGRSTASRRGCRAGRSRSAATTACCSRSGGQQTINVLGDAKPGFGEAGPNEQWYDPAVFAQPGNAWGNSGRNAFRGPSNWNLDASLFRTIPFGHYRARDPRRVAERVQPRAVGQPGDGLHRSQLHADPGFRQQSCAAHGAGGRSVRVLSVVACCARGAPPPRAKPAAGHLRECAHGSGSGGVR